MNFPQSSQSISSGHVLGVVGSANSMYTAFDNFERQARQRKYMIAECEDTIANLNLELKKVVKENKEVETECEKLDLEAKACEANYEKSLKEKSGIEAEYRSLSEEMDLINEDITRKQTKIDEIKSNQERKADFLSKAHKRYLLEYRKNPAIAKILDKNEECGRLEVKVQELTKALEELEEEVSETRRRYSLQWDSFTKKCIGIAESRSELIKKIQLRDRLKEEYDKKGVTPTIKKCIKLGLGIGADRKSGGSNSTPIVASRSSSLSSGINYFQGGFRSLKVNGGTAPSRSHRSSVFKEMDKILYKPSFGSRKRFGENTTQTSPGLGSIRHVAVGGAKSSPLIEGRSFVNDLRARLKGTVMVNPMPREVDDSSMSQPSDSVVINMDVEKANLASTGDGPNPTENSSSGIEKFSTRSQNQPKKDQFLQPTETVPRPIAAPQGPSKQIFEPDAQTKRTQAFDRTDNDSIPSPPAPPFMPSYTQVGEPAGNFFFESDFGNSGSGTASDNFFDAMFTAPSQPKTANNFSFF